MTSIERLYALYKAVRYIVGAGIPGDFVECGVWRGGSVMMMALTLRQLGETRRSIHCFDTFEGMPPPGDNDVHHRTGIRAAAILAREERRDDNVYWAIAPLDGVQRNVASTGYPVDKILYHKGKVEETLPGRSPPEVALLRLDTDWYASTRHELETLYPRLARGGVLIIDDYGFWRGARQATDEFLARTGVSILLNRIDDTGRIGVKIG